MARRDAGRLLRGAAAGLAASLVQAAIGKTEELAFLPPGEDADVAPRLMDRLAHDAGLHPSRAAEWAAGSVFHFGYGAAWGAAYAEVRERTRVHPALGGAMLGGLIYAITFPRWGGAVRTRTERPPGVRSRRMEVVALSVTLGFGLATSLLYERLSRR